MTAWLAGVTLKATLLLLAVAAVAYASRRSPAATRHFVWSSGLAALLLMPLLVASLPAWSPPWVAEWVPEYLVAGAAEPLPGDTPQSSANLVGSEFAELLLAPQSGADGEAAAHALAADISVGSRVLQEADGAGATRPGLSSATPWLLAAWALGAVMMVAWLAIGFVRRARLSRRCAVLEEGSILDASEAAAAALGLRRPIRVLIGESRFVPMTWGVLRPVLYLPAAARSWGAARLRTVLLHELAHIKRHDSLSRFLAQFACSVFWFHPLAWVSAKRMLREQERACDDVVIVAGADPHHYAETLVEIAREFRSPRPHVVGALAFSRRSNLEQRLLSILDPLERRKKMSSFRKALVALLFVGAVLPLAALQPVDAAQQVSGVQQPAQKQKPPPKVGVVAPRPDVAGVAVGVVVPRAEAVATGIGVVAPRADAADVAVGVVVPRAEVVAKGIGVAAPRADAADVAVGVVVPRAEAVATGIGVVAPQAEARAQVSRWTVVDPAAQIQLEAEGVVGVAAEVDGIELEPGGWLTITQQNRRLEIRPTTDGPLEFTYSEDGTERAFDGAAREWANGVMERMVEVGNLQGNVFVSIGGVGRISDMPSLSYEIAGVDSLRLAMEPLEMADMHLSLSLEQLETAMEPLMLSVEGLSVASEPLMVSVEGLETALEPLMLSVEGMSMNIEPLVLSLEGLETTMEPLRVTLEGLETTMEPLELSISQLALAGEAFDLDWVDEVGGRGFDLVHVWSDGGSRFVMMIEGSVDVGTTLDSIVIGEGAELVIDERADDGTRRRLHVFADESGVNMYEWHVDGEETPFDDAARVWLRSVLESRAAHDNEDESAR